MSEVWELSEEMLERYEVIEWWHHTGQCDRDNSYEVTKRYLSVESCGDCNIRYDNMLNGDESSLSEFELIEEMLDAR